MAKIENSFGDPDQERMAPTQLHALKIMAGMTAKEDMAKFEMLAGRTRFNNATLEEAYIQGLPHPILSKVHSQTMLPSRLNGWKVVVHNLDQLY